MLTSRSEALHGFPKATHTHTHTIKQSIDRRHTPPWLNHDSPQLTGSNIYATTMLGSLAIASDTYLAAWLTSSCCCLPCLRLSATTWLMVLPRAVIYIFNTHMLLLLFLLASRELFAARLPGQGTSTRPPPATDLAGYTTDAMAFTIEEMSRLSMLFSFPCNDCDCGGDGRLRGVIFFCL